MANQFMNYVKFANKCVDKYNETLSKTKMSETQ